MERSEAYEAPVFEVLGTLHEVTLGTGNDLPDGVGGVGTTGAALSGVAP